MRPAADLLVLAEDHALASARSHAKAEQAEHRGNWGDAQAYRIEAGTLAETSLALSQLAQARAIYTSNEPTWVTHEMGGVPS